MAGKGELILTGQLGDVMKESARAALSLLKAKAEALGIDVASFQGHDIHVHVPAGAIPKDGPSAGVAMFLALASLFTGRTIASDIRRHRRDQPARTRAAGGRHQGEGARGPPGRARARAAPQAQ